MNGCIEQTALLATTPCLFDEIACRSHRHHAVTGTLRTPLDPLAPPTRPAARLPTTRPTTVRSNDRSHLGFDSRSRNSKLLTRLRPVSPLAVLRRTALKGTRIRFETAVSKIRLRRMKNRKAKLAKLRRCRIADNLRALCRSATRAIERHDSRYEWSRIRGAAARYDRSHVQEQPPHRISRSRTALRSRSRKRRAARDTRALALYDERECVPTGTARQ